MVKLDVYHQPYDSQSPPDYRPDFARPRSLEPYAYRANMMGIDEFGNVSEGVSTAMMVGGGIILVAGLLLIGGLYNNWAYGDWRCMLKRCEQTNSKRD